MKTAYYTFGGTILAEEQIGAAGYRNYGADALGSVVATYDSTGKAQNTYRYSPYGQTVLSQAAAPTPYYTWVGSLGYRQTTRHLPEFYIRARHYSSILAAWTSPDAIWPNERAYAYVGANPISDVDPSGLAAAAPYPVLAPTSYCGNGFLGIGGDIGTWQTVTQNIKYGKVITSYNWPCEAQGGVSCLCVFEEVSVVFIMTAWKCVPPWVMQWQERCSGTDTIQKRICPIQMSWLNLEKDQWSINHCVTIWP